VIESSPSPEYRSRRGSCLTPKMNDDRRLITIDRDLA
jgi:hypothetical protein